ncbi:MAG: cytochrome c oxidase subunit II, partial [Actinomycetota bacterium]
DGRARRYALLLLLLAAPVLAACSLDTPQSTLVPEGEFARRADTLFKGTFIIVVVVFVLVEGALLYVLARYRRRSDSDAPVQVHGNTRLEVIWTIIPTLILAGVAVPTVKLIFDFAARPKGDVLEVKVVGQRWWWEYQYPGLGVITANELHIPVGRPVVLSLESKDVIHSYWVPKLAGKQDVVPGQTNHLTLKADRPGEYRGQCAEYCGLSHANMRNVVISHTPEDFETWVKEQQQAATIPTDALAREGMDFLVNGPCAGCHAVKGTNAQATLAPDLTHFASRQTFAGSIFANNTENLAAWLRDPPKRKAMNPNVERGAGMPSYNLSEDQIRALVAYLQSLE